MAVQVGPSAGDLLENLLNGCTLFFVTFVTLFDRQS